MPQPRKPARRSSKGPAPSRTSPRRPSSGRRAKKKRLMTPEDLLQFQLVGGARVSPDGRRVVFVVKTFGKKNEYLTNLWMAEVGGEARRFTSGDKDAAPAWSPDGHTIAFVSRRDKHRPQLALIDSEGGEARTLTDLPEGSIASFKWSPCGRWLALSFREQATHWTSAAKEEREETGASDPPRVLDDPWYRLDGDGYFDAQRFHLYAVDAETGGHRVLYDKDRTGVSSYDVSPDGKEVALVTHRERFSFARYWTSELIRVDANSRKVRPVEGVPAGGKESVKWSPDGKRLAFTWANEDGTRPGDNLELWVADLGKRTAKSLTGKEDHCLLAPVLSDSSEVEFSSTYAWTPDGKRLWVQIGRHGETQLATVSARGGPLRFHTSGHAQHAFGNLSSDGARMALVVGDATYLGEAHVADVPSSAQLDKGAELALTKVCDLNKPFLSGLELSKPTAHWVTSNDGVKVHAWVMLPPGASKSRRRPTTVQVHGGPHAQYGWAFFHEFQVLAAKGYAVVFSNPRGSKGYGRDFCDGNTHSWGQQDWRDVEAVSQWTAEQPWCDEALMGISGGSFGGFMTLWAIGHTRMFRAAVADRCVCNMVSMWGSSDVYEWPDSYLPGNTWDDTKALWDMSPLKYLGNARTPTLLIHSEGDLRCNVAESEQAYAVLSMRGVPTRFVRYPRNTSHGMSRAGPPDMRLHRLHQYLDWWAKWLGGKP